MKPLFSVMIFVCTLTCHASDDLCSGSGKFNENSFSFHFYLGFEAQGINYKRSDIGKELGKELGKDSIPEKVRNQIERACPDIIKKFVGNYAGAAEALVEECITFCGDDTVCSKACGLAKHFNKTYQDGKAVEKVRTDACEAKLSKLNDLLTSSEKGTVKEQKEQKEQMINERMIKEMLGILEKSSQFKYEDIEYRKLDGVKGR